MSIFGPDGVPNGKDVTRLHHSLGLGRAQEDAHFADDFDYENEYEYEEYGAYEYDDFNYDAYEGDDDAYLGYDHDDTVEDDEDVPEELNTSYDQCEEAYLGYLEARKRMRDLANARGFYPIVALADDNPRSTAPRSRGKDGKKGKGRGKGKGKGAS